MPAPARTGRPRRWCSDRCRKQATARRAAESAWQSLGELAELPTDPLTLQRRTLEALADTIEGTPAGPPEDRLVACILEARQLAFALRRLAPDLAPALRARAGLLADAIRGGVDREFGGILP